LETKKIVLVHGEGFGAWCWYKTISHLEEAGLDPVALDLTGSGIDHTDTNSIATLADYSKPLIDYLDRLPEDEKVAVTSAVLCIYSIFGRKQAQPFLTECCVCNGDNAGHFGRP
jgi:pimeloyl-ACP methyl ester carboxylesterase